jgi:purine nucleoside phosphorylase
VYCAVAGPQFETRAEVGWLAGYGDVVGMSAAPELRAAQRAGAETLLLALVANRAAEVGSHEEVLQYGAGAARDLSAGLGAAIAARWPRVVPS